MLFHDMRDAVSTVPSDERAEHGVAKDPICGMVVEKATALRVERGARTYYFCSPNCVRTFESPEAELKAGPA